jgi:hypothetical protein
MEALKRSLDSVSQEKKEARESGLAESRSGEVVEGRRQRRAQAQGVLSRIPNPGIPEPRLRSLSNEPSSRDRRGRIHRVPRGGRTDRARPRRHILDDLSGGFRENVPRRLHSSSGSVVDHALVDRLFAEHRFDHVYHLAAYAAEGLSHSSSASTTRTTSSAA